MLIDGGPDRSVLEQLGQVIPFWDRTIDIVVATHPDKDHIAGLIPVVEYFKVGRLIDNGAEHDTVYYEQLELSHDSLASVGEQVWWLDRDAGVYMQVLDGAGVARAGSDSNDQSLILRLVYGNASVLLTGDASSAVERALVRQYGDSLRSDILKLGHHGSKTSTSQYFLDTVQPQIVVASAGCDNRYGHPHPDIVARVSHARLFDTCVDGLVKLHSDGVSWR